jgi:hypothetical protein
MWDAERRQGAKTLNFPTRRCVLRHRSGTRFSLLGSSRPEMETTIPSELRDFLASPMALALASI